MDEGRDFSLLEDDDNDFNLNQNDQQLSKVINTVKIQAKTRNNSITLSNQPLKINTTPPQTQIKQVNKLNISPNRPNQTKLELKSIERPRSHSPLKMTGIEEYIKNYEKRKSIDLGNEDSINQNNKITMNLKMDDLLANKNESNSYQVLSDFSVLTGDIDTSFGSKFRNRKTSLDKSNFNNDYVNPNNDEDNDDENYDDDNDDEHDEEHLNKKQDRNLSYKYTAVYKIDESTGLVQEQSKTIFESKKGDIAPIRPKPPVLVTSVTSVTTKSTSEPIETNNFFKSQLESALEALKNNSKNLENKLDKLDDITPSSNTYFDSSSSFALNQNISNNNAISQQETVLSSNLKKKNDNFFNEFLSKSDDLIAQTQNKLEKLSKLDTVTKPLAPLANTQSTSPKPKPKPTATILINQQPQQTQNLSLTSQTMSINNSKSLIDLKSNETQLINNTTNSNQEQVQTSTQVDLLFDLNSDQSFVLSTEPIKQNESYFDLIGLSSTNNQDLLDNEQAETFKNNSLNLNPDLLKLTETSSSNHESASSTPISSSPFKDDLLESIISNDLTLNQVKPQSDATISIISLLQNKKNDTIKLEQNQNSLSNIDILITEPLNEHDDNHVVPEDYFNLKHEAPNEQSTSRPHSPIDSSTVVVTTTTNSRPITPINTNRSSRPPSPTALIRSRPASPKQLIAQPIIHENETETETKLDKEEIEKNIEIKKEKLSNINNNSSSNNKNKKKIWTISDSQGESNTSSSSSSDDDEKQKFQVRIRPKAIKSLNSDTNDVTSKPTFVPLLPKPPKSAEEIEEFRQRRRSSDACSITRSIKDDSSSSEDNDNDVKVVKAENVTKSNDRKESVVSEFNLELPDEDDSLPLNDFNEKCELTKYSDGNYGCIVLVRQPFRNPNVLYKNALQKMTEVRTWTECLVKLVDSETGGKKLVFYNAHELITLAAEHETTIENIIDLSVVNNKKKDACLLNEVEKETNENENMKKIVEKIYPFHEIELKTSYKFTDMCLQQYDNYTKIHTFKLQDVIFKETVQLRPDRIMALPERFLKRFTKAKVTSLLDHTPLPIEICKIGHLSYTYLRSFLLLLQDAFWSLPTITRKKQREEQLLQIQQQPVSSTMSITAAAASLFSLGSNKQIQTPTLTSVTAIHTREEVTVKVVDEYRCKLDKECRIKEHKSRTRVYLTVFLNSPDPIIEIGLNDVLRHGKEIVGRYEIIPIKTEQWISPELFELNEKVVDKDEFEKTHCLRCIQMPDNLLVEIMRFRTRPRRNYELPLQVRCFMNVINRQVEIRIECTVAGTYFTNLSDVFCEDIQIRFPLPDVWVYLFRVEKMFRYGAVHSTKSKLGKIKGLDRLLVHKSGQQGALMEASCGVAKYEQAFKSLVWRIDQLPVKNKDIYKTQLFVCKLNLQEYDNLPDKYDEIAQVQYSIPICATSKCQVRSVSVPTSEDPPEKWAKLKSKFEYDLEINYSFDQQNLPVVDQEKCAELQHLTVTESEGDKTEDDDD